MKYLRKFNEIIDMIDSSVDKVLLKYPNLSIKIIPEDEECINIEITK